MAAVTNAQGFTVYSFRSGHDHHVEVHRRLRGDLAAGDRACGCRAGVAGRLDTIARSDGSTQVTFDGHPLDSYTAGTAPNHAKDNGINVDGGVWHEVIASGQSVPAGSSGGSGGGGYGYRQNQPACRRGQSGRQPRP